MRVRTAFIVALVVLIGVSGASFAQKDQGTKVTLSDGPGFQPRETVSGNHPLDLGGIIYDDGSVDGTLGVSSVTVGNQFDTSNGNPLTASGTIFSASIYWASVSGTAAFLSIYDQQAGTSANVLLSSSLPAATGFVGYSGLSVGYVGNSFLLGGWQPAATASDIVGVSSGTTNGQGFHGMTINDISGTGFNRPGTFNMVGGASGNIIIPVELMDFEIVDD